MKKFALTHDGSYVALFHPQTKTNYVIPPHDYTTLHQCNGKI